VRARFFFLLVAAFLAACSKRARPTPAPAESAVSVVPNVLRPCADLARCEEACRHGDESQCLAAANNYATGDGVAQDEARATSLLETACSARSGAGCNLAGRMYEFGHGVPRDAAKALSLYERACSEGYMGGCYNVAVLVEEGKGAPRDTARAIALYQKVCDAGSRAACAAVNRLGSSPAPKP
jgi:TPR repeat protein